MQNAATLQHKEIEKDARLITVVAKGNGFPYVQVSYKYSTILEDLKRQFDLTVAVKSGVKPRATNLQEALNAQTKVSRTH